MRNSVTRTLAKLVSNCYTIGAMAPKAKVPKEKTIIETPVLDELGLEVGSAVKFRRGLDNWTKGTLKGDAKDGSLSIVDQHGKWRAIMPENVMLSVRGPRGGKLWKPVIEEVES